MAARIKESLHEKEGESQREARAAALETKHNWTRSDAEEAIARMIDHAEILGFGENAISGRTRGPIGAVGLPVGEAAIPASTCLVAVDPELLDWLIEFGSDCDDEPDQDFEHEQQGFNNPMLTLTGPTIEAQLRMMLEARRRKVIDGAELGTFRRFK